MNIALICGVISALFMACVAFQCQDGFLVTMKRRELLEYKKCIKNDHSKEACDHYLECNKKLPAPIVCAMKDCHKSIIPKPKKRCIYHEKRLQFPYAEAIPLSCALLNAPKLTPKESRQMVEYEDCVREYMKNGCPKNG